MADLHRMEIVIDRDADLAPQVIVYRAEGVPWAILERLSGRKKNRLEEAIDRWRKRQAERKAEPAMV
jgi:hypothetical protein